MASGAARAKASLSGSTIRGRSSQQQPTLRLRRCHARSRSRARAIPEERRQVILLISLEAASYEEAATILDVPMGTIRSRLSRGRESRRILMHWRDGTEAVSAAAVTSTVPKRRRFLPEVETNRILVCCQCSPRSRDDHHRHRGCSQGWQRSAMALPLSPLSWIIEEHGAPDLASSAWFGARFPRSVPPQRKNRGRRTPPAYREPRRWVDCGGLGRPRWTSAIGTKLAISVVSGSVSHWGQSGPLANCGQPALFMSTCPRSKAIAQCCHLPMRACTNRTRIRPHFNPTRVAPGRRSGSLPCCDGFWPGL
jgi:Sigma-70, region 4